MRNCYQQNESFKNLRTRSIRSFSEGSLSISELIPPPAKRCWTEGVIGAASSFLTGSAY